MRREFEEEHAKKMAELDSRQKDIDKLVEDAMQKIIQKLPLGVVQEFLT